MGTNVIARLDGDHYQALIFWSAGANLIRGNKGIEKVAWESPTHPGFDDVEIHYHAPGRLCGQKRIRTDYLQVKHHASHAKAFTYEALMDPDFIGTVKSSILSRLYDAYKKDPDIATHSRLIIINTWGCDPKDQLSGLIGKDGALRLNILFDGKGDDTRYGMVRKAWREYLQLTSDDELRKVLVPLHIRHSSPDLESMIEQLSDKLELAKLQPIAPDQRSLNGLVELIQRLHSDGKTEFSKDELQKICKEEGITLKEVIIEDKHVIGVRSFYKGAQDLHLEVNDMLCLLDHFTGRFLHETSSWPQVYKQISDTAQRAVTFGKPVRLHLDTHLTVAFTLGYGLNSKSGVPVTVVQKTANAKLHWAVDLDTLPQQPGDNWTFDTHAFNNGGNDLTVCISVTHNILHDVKCYEQAQQTPPGKLLSAVINPGPSGTVFKSGNHIYAAVQELVARIRQEKQSLPGATVRLYMSAPVAFAFFLGQVAASVGRLSLFEFDFEQLRDGSYHQTISLPIVKH